MTAKRAYITSFGTTGLLIASAFLSLFVVSAFVAFNGFPGQDIHDPIGTLVLQQQQSPVVTVPTQPAGTAAARSGGRTPTAAGATGRAGAPRAGAPSPLAGVSPVAGQTPVSKPAAQLPGTSTVPPSATLPASSTTPVTTPGIPTGGAPPSLPSASVPPPPSVTVPPLGQSGSLPVDTSGVTKALGG